MALYLHSLKEVLPPFSMRQDIALNWLMEAHGRIIDDPERAMKLRKLIERYGCSPKQIGMRYGFLGDFLTPFDQPCEIFDFRPEGLAMKGGALMTKRMEVYSREADKVIRTLHEHTVTPPKHLLHVTCTGYQSPSGVQKLVSEKGWSKTQVLHLYHMGCYASIPALRVAQGFSDGFAHAAQDRVDVVHTELCLLHFNTLNHSPEQLVVQGLFADGAIGYSIQKAAPKGPGFEILSVRETIVPHTEEAMSWGLGELGMNITLSRDVPSLLANVLPEFVAHLIEEGGGSGDIIFAVHPGGPKIIDGVQATLDLSEDRVRHSRDVLFERGNMSSVTLPTIWSKMVNDSSVASGTRVVSLAFGPGLTVAGAVLRKL